MRVIFFGTSEFAVPSLEGLAVRHPVVMCVTQPGRPQGRGLMRESSPVKRAAIQLGLPLSQPQRLEAGAFTALHPDVGVVIAYGKLIARELLTLPAQGMVGVHPSLLPKYRGAAPIAHALLNGETRTGVTIFQLNEALDAGPILSQHVVEIAPEEDAEALGHRLARVGAEQLVETVDALAAGRAVPRPQHDATASFAPKLTKAQGRIDWHQPAAAIARLVRATMPWPGASTEWQGKALKIWKALALDAVQHTEHGRPGTVVHVDADGIRVAAADGVVVIHELQLAGRRRMRASEFLAGHPVREGAHFGTGDKGQET